MQARQINLADLLTATGVAAGTANARLRALNAPALLAEFTFEVGLQAALGISCDLSGVELGNVARPNAQMTAMMGENGSNVTITAKYIAAPSLVPVPST